MRVSTASRYDSALDTLQRRQGELSKAQAQLTSGKRVNQPSDDPTAAARAERMHIAQMRLRSEQRMVDVSRNAMTLAESALGQAGEIMQAARETLVAAGDAGYGPSDRAALAAQLRQLRGQLLQLANQPDGAGGYTFGGLDGVSKPFVDNPAGVAFVATPGQAEVSSVEHMPTAVDGQAIWLAARSGNGVFVTDAAASNAGSGWIDAGASSDATAQFADSYQIVLSAAGGGAMNYSVLKNGAAAVAGGPYTSGKAITFSATDVGGATFTMTASISGQPANGDTFTVQPSASDQSIFATLDRAIAVLGNGGSSGGQVSQAVSSGLRDIDSVMAHTQAARAVTGADLARLDSIDSRNQDRELWAKSVQSDAEDLDMVQAVSEFQNQQTGYQAALQTYAMVQRMSLFDYIK